MGYIGVDLDGTLVLNSDWQNPEHVGRPVPRMLARVKRWLAEGREVRIITARANANGRKPGEAQRILDAIRGWCREHIGQELQISCCKDCAMLELWDDRAVQVVPDTGDEASAAALREAFESLGDIPGGPRGFR